VGIQNFYQVMQIRKKQLKQAKKEADFFIAKLVTLI
jgi:hypothetical protein